MSFERLLWDLRRRDLHGPSRRLGYDSYLLKRLQTVEDLRLFLYSVSRGLRVLDFLGVCPVPSRSPPRRLLTSSGKGP